MRVAFRQRLLEFGVKAVDVVKKMDGAFVVHERGAVKNENWDGLGEVDLHIVLAALHCSSNSFQIPSRIISQDPRRQFGRMFHADAAVTEVPARLRKQLDRRSAVQIDAVFIGKHEFYEPKSVRRARLLSHH
jgi:hypothetical protein